MNYWNNFEQFKRSIKAIGKEWESEDVYFSQFRDGYSAAYKPYYPEDSNRDMIINLHRGNYELIRYHNGKFDSEYFTCLDEIEREKNGNTGGQNENKEN